MEDKIFSRIIIPLVIIVGMFLTSLIGVRILWKSKMFHNKFQEEIGFQLGADYLRIKYDKIQARGFYSFKMSNLKIYTAYSEKEVLLSAEKLFFSPKIKWRPFSFMYNFNLVVNSESGAVGSYVIPFFPKGKLSFVNNDIDAYMGDLILNVKKLPIAFVLGLLKNKLSTNLIRGMSGNITGQLNLVKDSPYGLETIKAKADVTLDNLKVSCIGLNLKNQFQKYEFVLNPISKVFILSNQKLGPLGSIDLRNDSGSVRLDGFLKFEGKDLPDFDLTLVGDDSDLFEKIKRIFACFTKNQKINLRGFKNFTCM